MSSEFQPRYLSYDSNIATAHRHLYSTILAEFPWYSESLALKPESILAYSDQLPGFEACRFLSSLHGFEDALLSFSGDPRTKDILGLLGVKVITTTEPESSRLVMASHEPNLSTYDFQKLCSVLCAYRFFEIVSLRAQCIPRVPISTPTARMFLPGPPSSKDGLEVFSRLQDWPNMALTFKSYVQKSADAVSQFREYSNPLFSLMHMAAKNGFKTKYLAIEENFLLAAIHIAAIKNIPFAAGTIPDLPADMPSMPPGGCQDTESYESFETQYNAFLKKCQTEGCPSSAPVGSRSPFQLACLISPLYLLSTIRLSTKSFHRRTVIDLAAKLGPHKSPRVLAVESRIWDALFRLAEGHTSAYVVLWDLEQSMPWSDIDSAARCDADKQCFSPALPMPYAPAISFVEPKLLLPSPSSPSVLCPITVSNSVANALGRIPSTDFAGAPLGNHLPLQLTSLSATSALVDTEPGPKSSDSSSEPASSSGNPPSPSVPRPNTISDSFANALARTLNTAFGDAPLGNHLPVNPLQPTSRSAHASTQVDARSGSESHSSSTFEPASSPGNMDIDHDEPDIVPNESDFLQSALNRPDLLQRRGTYPDDNGSDSDSDSSSESGSSKGDMDVDHDEGDIVINESDLIQSVFDRPELLQPHGSHSDDDQSDGPSLPAGTAKTVRDGVDPAPKKSSHSKKSRTSTIRRSGGAAKKPRGSHSDDAQSDGPSSPAGAADGGDLVPTQSSTNKRRRSPSPVVLRGLGTKENPIELDKVASLFEPMVIRDYVKKEEISLPLEVEPPTDRSITYTIFDVKGEPVSFNPKFHFAIYHNRFHQFFDRIKMFYDGGQPLHIARPDDSIIKTFAYEEWRALTAVQMQQELRRKNVIVSGWPVKDNISFNEAGLRKVAGTPSRQISINDYSIKPSGNHCRPTVVSGRVRDLWDNRHSSGKILNALDLPLYDGNTEPTEYASDLHAWDVTRGHHCIDPASPYPTEHMRWALVGHENAITFLHIDCEGLSTDLLVAAGGKAWGFLRERNGNPLSSMNFFLKDSFRLDEVLDSSDYDFEIVALRPGDRLFMMPCQPHFVFGYAHSICVGGHSYLTHHMQGTLRGLIHSFVLHQFLTNIAHPTRVLLRRMVLFYHMGLIEDEIPESDPAASHLPNVKEFAGLMDLLSACVLVILGNVLDFRTYRAPSQDEYKRANKNQQILIDHEINSIAISERFAICYARGVALHLFDWIRICSEIRGPGGAIITDLPSRFFIQIAQTLIKYKEGANSSKLDLQANCTLGMLTKQIENVVKVDPRILSLWSERHLLPCGSLALANQEEYSVQWPESRRKNWSSIEHDFMDGGITPLDRLCFEAQQDRQHLESSVVIPRLKTSSSTIQHPPKRIKP